MYQFGYLVGQLLAFLLFLVPAVLFLLAQQNTLKIIRRENRELHPALVWLQLIPVFNFFWMFIVVTRIADSLSKESAALQDNSILGVPDMDAVKGIGQRPTYKIGMTYCVLYLLLPLMIICANLFGGEGGTTDEVERTLPFSFGALSLAAMTCWIIYWVKLAAQKRKLTASH
jgi:hypothetical protein